MVRTNDKKNYRNIFKTKITRNKIKYNVILDEKLIYLFLDKNYNE